MFRSSVLLRPFRKLPCEGTQIKKYYLSIVTYDYQKVKDISNLRPL